MIIGSTARNVTIVCNLLAFSRKDLMVASGYRIDAMKTKTSILSTDGILYNFLACPSRAYVVLVQNVNDLVSSMS